MEKKLYSMPQTEVEMVNTELLQHISSPSAGGHMPPGPKGAPTRHGGDYIS